MINSKPQSDSIYLTTKFSKIPETLLVKNMVCHRCMLAVEEVLTRSAIPFDKVITGEIHLPGKISAKQTDLLSAGLASIVLELIDNRMSGLIERIKQLVIRKARNEVAGKETKAMLSVYLSQHLHHDYTYLSSFFSSIEGRTIENYFIEHPIFIAPKKSAA